MSDTALKAREADSPEEKVTPRSSNLGVETLESRCKGSRQGPGSLCFIHSKEAAGLVGTEGTGRAGVEVRVLGGT